jgi:DNA-binding CsgD family transcriptional regulator
VVFRDPDQKDPSLVGRLRSLYGLTQAEAELAAALGEGVGVTEIVAARGVRESTVRSQLKALAAKMRCRRIAEIAALVARMPPLQGGWSS